MLLSSAGIVEQIKALLTSITEMPLEVESILAILGFIASIVAVVWQGVLSFLTIVSSYNIEIAFMTKKERIKYNISSYIMYAVALWFVNLMYGFCFGFVDEQKPVVSLGAVLMLALVGILLLLTVFWLIGRFIKKLTEVHLCRFLGAILKRGIFRISTFIKKVISGIGRMCGELWRKIKGCRFLVSFGNVTKPIYEHINNLWKGCAVDKTNVEKIGYPKGYGIRATGFILTTIIGIIFNCLFAVYAKDEYNVFVGGTLVTILTMEIAFLYLNFDINPKDSRIYYYDDIWQKYVFIYFRQDEDHCIGGDADILGDCNELFLVPYEKIEKQKIYSISKWKQDRVNIDNKRIHLQHGLNEFMMNGVLDKIKNELQSKEIVPKLMEKADIYVKPEEKKAYYVLADGTKGDIDL